MNWNIERIIGGTRAQWVLAALVYGALCGAILMRDYGWPGLAVGLASPFFLFGLIGLLNWWDWFPLPFVVFLLISVAAPAYRDYLVRHGVADEVFVPMRPVLAAAERHLTATKKFPARLEDLGIAAPATRALKQVAFDSAAARVNVAFDASVFLPDHSVASVLRGDLASRTIVFELRHDANGRFGWRCRSPDMESSLLPRDCAALQ